MKKKRIVSTLAALTLFSALLLAIAIDRTLAQSADPVKALVVEGLGDTVAIVATMQSLGWEVTTAGVLDVDQQFVNGLNAYDVVWVTAGTDVRPMQLLARPGNILDQFAAAGGVVVVTDVSPPNHIWLDIAPGGLDAQTLPASGAGAVTIAATEHPLISGTGIGGVTLNAAYLDPELSGGGCCVVNPPDNSAAVVIAQNSIGPVLLEHTHGTGHVLVSALLNQQDNCTQNVLYYVEFLTQ